MEKIIKTKTIEEEWYKATDGTEFHNKTDCENYEQTNKCAIRCMFKELGAQCTESFSQKDDIFCFPTEDDMYAIKINSSGQIRKINEWLRSKGETNNLLPASTLGTIQLIDAFADDDGFWFLGTPDELKARFCSAIDKLFDKLIDETEEEEDT